MSDINRRFQAIENNAKDDHKMLIDHHAIITNGLVDKVNRLEKEAKWLIRLVVTTVLGILAQILISVLKQEEREMQLSDRAKAIIEAIAFIVLLIVNLVAWLAGWAVPAIIITGVQLIVGWLIGKTFVWPKLPNTAKIVAPDIANAIAVEKRRLNI